MKIVKIEFGKDVIISGIIHFVLLIIFGYNAPSMFNKLPEPENIIMFDVLPVSSKVNIKTQSPKTAIKPEDKQDEKPLAQIKKSNNVEKPTEIIKSIKIEEDKKEALVKEIKEEKIITPIKEDKKEAKKKEIKPIKGKQKPQEDPMDSLLKNLEQDLTVNQPNNEETLKKNSDEDKKYFKGDDFDQRSPMSITEVMLIKKKIEQNWRIPQSVQNLKDVKITVEIFLKNDGTIDKIDIIKVVCPHNGQVCALAKESIVRAIKTTNRIENLSPTRYDIWKNLKLVFDPGSIF